MENLEKDKHTLLKSYASLPPQKTIFYRYDTFIERSCEQLNIAKRQQMNVEITAKINDENWLSQQETFSNPSLIVNC